jgi:G3E family GTPase
MEDIKELIKKVNPTAQLHESKYSNVPLDLLLEKN